MDYTFTTTAGAFDADLASQGWSTAVNAAVSAAKSLADLTKASAVEVSVAVGTGGWCVIRIAPFNPES